MKNITKIIAMAAMLALAIPSVGLAHGNTDNDGRDDKAGIMANLGIRTELKDIREDNKKDVEDDRGEHFKLNNGENFWMGTVTAKGIGIVTIRLHDGTIYTVNTVGATFSAHKGMTFVFSDIQVNDKIFVSGALTGSTVSATKIFDISLPNHKGKVKGAVTAINGNTFTVTTKDNRIITVNTDGSTVVKQNGLVVALSNILVGSKVMIRGIWNSTTLDTLVASMIKIK